MCYYLAVYAAVFLVVFLILIYVTRKGDAQETQPLAPNSLLPNNLGPYMDAAPYKKAE